MLFDEKTDTNRLVRTQQNDLRRARRRRVGYQLRNGGLTDKKADPLGRKNVILYYGRRFHQFGA